VKTGANFLEAQPRGVTMGRSAQKFGIAALSKGIGGTARFGNCFPLSE